MQLDLWTVNFISAVKQGLRFFEVNSTPSLKINLKWTPSFDEPCNFYFLFLLKFFFLLIASYYIYGKTSSYCFYLNALKYPLVSGNIKTSGLITLSKSPIKYLKLVFVLTNFEISILSTWTSQISIGYFGP